MTHKTTNQRAKEIVKDATKRARLSWGVGWDNLTRDHQRAEIYARICTGFASFDAGHHTDVAAARVCRNVQAAIVMVAAEG